MHDIADARFPCGTTPSTEGVSQRGAVVVLQREQRSTKAGKPYLVLQVGNCNGRFEFRVWSEGVPDWTDAVVGTPLELECVSVPGYRGGYEWAPTWHRVLPSDHPVAAEVLPPCPRPHGELYDRTRAVVGQCSPTAMLLLHVLLSTVVQWADGLREPVISRLRRWPAAVSHHHAMGGGLWWHSVQVAECAVAMAKALATDAVRTLSIDTVVLGALLHDVGKGDELLESAAFANPGRQATHVLWGAMRLQEAFTRAQAEGWQPSDAERTLFHEVVHIVASHHNTLEWGANAKPISREAWLVHAADLVSANVEKTDAACRAGTAEDEPGWLLPAGGWQRDRLRVVPESATESLADANLDEVLRLLEPPSAGATPYIAAVPQRRLVLALVTTTDTEE